MGGSRDIHTTDYRKRQTKNESCKGVCLDNNQQTFHVVTTHSPNIPQHSLKIFLDRNGFVAIISTKTVELIEMETGLSDEAVDKGEIRGEADAGVGSPLRGGAHPAEGYRRAPGDLREVPLAAHQSPEDDGACQFPARSARRLRLGKAAGGDLPEGDPPGSGRVPLPGRLRGQPVPLRTVTLLHLPGRLGGGVEEHAADVGGYDHGGNGGKTEGEVEE